MHFSIITMEPEVAARLRVDSARQHGEPADAEEFYALKRAGPAYTLMEDDEPLISAGLVQQWAGRWVAWALLAADLPMRKMVIVHREVKNFLDGFDARRIEMYVAADFPDGEKWARKLGFNCEGRMRAFFPDGADAFMYARTH